MARLPPLREPHRNRQIDESMRSTPGKLPPLREAESLSDFHFAEPGDAMTACDKQASGKGGVLFKTDNPARVTCYICRRRKGIRGAAQASAKRVAEAGRVIEAAIARYGGIVQARAPAKRTRR